MEFFVLRYRVVWSFIWKSLLWFIWKKVWSKAFTSKQQNRTASPTSRGRSSLRSSLTSADIEGPTSTTFNHRTTGTTTTTKTTLTKRFPILQQGKSHFTETAKHLTAFIQFQMIFSWKKIGGELSKKMELFPLIFVTGKNSTRLWRTRIWMIVTKDLSIRSLLESKVSAMPASRLVRTNLM